MTYSHDILNFRTSILFISFYKDKFYARVQYLKKTVFLLLLMKLLINLKKQLGFYAKYDFANTTQKKAVLEMKLEHVSRHTAD